MSRKSEKPKPVSVYVRCRPRNSYEKSAGSHSIVECTKKEVIVKTNINKKYTFDHVYGPASSQVDLYKGVAASTVEEVLQGYNCTIFAYGQTGTGKTFTMEGNRSVGSNIPWQKDPSIGLIPRTMSHMFDRLNSQASDYSVRVSMMEMYNEELFDLLSSGDNSQKLRLFEDSTRKVTRGLGSVVIQGLEEVQVMSKDEVYNLMERAMQKRQTAETLLNKHSSRSHVVFTVTVHIKTVSQGDECEEEVFKMGKLNLVDLAGSENIGRSGAQNSRAREAGNINQSLLTLGRVITALVDRTPHVPYRESKLTRLLQDSLGGRTQTSIIATISPAHCNLEETLSTLDYANRAKNILNKPEVNQRSSKKTLIKEYTAEIDKLKRELLNSREKSGVYLEYDKFNEMEMRMKSQSQLIKDKEDELSSLIDARSKISSLFSNSIRQIDGLHKKIDRKERVESQNKTLINNYIQNTKNHYAMFSQYITERRETLRDRHDILCKSINSSKELGDEIHSQSSDSLNELIRTVAKSLSTALHQRDSQNEHWIEEYLTKELQPAIQSTVQYTTQLKQQYEAAHSSLIDIVKRDTELTNKKCDDMVAAIEYMITSVEKDLSKISDVIDDQYAFVEQSRKDQKAVVLETLAEGQVSLKKKMQEATQLLESFTELFDNKVRQRQIAVDNIHLQTTQVLNESKCEVKEQLKEISLNVHLGSKSLMDGHVQPLREQLLSQSQQVVGESESNSEASKRKVCELGVSMESVGERIKRMNTLCKEYHSSSAAQADIDHGNILTEGNQSPTQPHLRDIFNNRCKMEMLNSESMTAYRKHIQAIADNTTSLATCASEMCDETGGMVNESSARIQDLSEHVTEDLPTGATPKRAKLNRLVLHQNSGFNLDMIESDEENSDPNLSDPSLSMSFS